MDSPGQPTKRQASKRSKANPMPFSAIPKALLRDPELLSTDKVLAGLILPWLKKRPSGFVLNSILASQAGIDRRTIPRSLDRLEAALWFRVETGPTYPGQRRITALWRTKAGLRALEERLDRLEVDKGYDTRVPPPSSRDTQTGRRNQRECKQRIQLERDHSEDTHEEFCAPSSAFDPVVSEQDDNQVQEQSRRRMARLARDLAGMDENDPDARDVVDQFADASLDVVWDTKASRRYHCKVGLALLRDRLSVASFLGVLDGFAAKFDSHQLENEAGWYVSKVDPMILPEPDESAAN